MSRLAPVLFNDVGVWGTINQGLVITRRVVSGVWGGMCISVYVYEIV